MAIFNHTPDEKDRLDWQILQNGWTSLYWQLSILDKDLDWLKKEKYIIRIPSPLSPMAFCILIPFLDGCLTCLELLLIDILPLC